MSTRGYVTILDEKKNIALAAYSNSDSYPSNLGVQVLESIEKGELAQLIGEMRSEVPEDIEMVKGIQRSWYIKSKDNKDDFFNDYAYEYESASGNLNIYHYGDKALAFKPDQFPLSKFIFEHEYELYCPLILDEKSMSLKKDFYKEVRAMLRSGASETDFQAVIDKKPSVLYLDYGRIVDSWNRNSRSFNKRVCDSKTNQKLMFHVSEDYSGRFSLYICSPFFRKPFGKQNLSSPTAAERALAELVRTRPEDIRCTMRVFHDIEEYQRDCKELAKASTLFPDDFSNAIDKASRDLMARIHKELSTLNADGSIHRVIGFDEGSIRKEIDQDCRNFRAKYAEKHPPLADLLTEASSRAEAASSGSDKTLPEKEH